MAIAHCVKDIGPMKGIVVIIPMLLVMAASELLAQGQAATKTSPAILQIPLSEARGSQTGAAGRLTFTDWFYETAQGRVPIPAQVTAEARIGAEFSSQAYMPDGRVVTFTFQPEGKNSVVHLSAKPDTGILRWGVAVDSLKDEFYTGLMERVVDGPQKETWAPGRKEAMDLRGQNVEMIL
jgi:hypothetical protein